MCSEARTHPSSLELKGEHAAPTAQAAPPLEQGGVAAAGRGEGAVGACQGLREAARPDTRAAVAVAAPPPPPKAISSSSSSHGERVSWGGEELCTRAARTQMPANARSDPVAVPHTPQDLRHPLEGRHDGAARPAGGGEPGGPRAGAKGVGVRHMHMSSHAPSTVRLRLAWTPPSTPHPGARPHPSASHCCCICIIYTHSLPPPHARRTCPSGRASTSSTSRSCASWRRRTTRWCSPRSGW